MKKTVGSQEAKDLLAAIAEVANRLGKTGMADKAKELGGDKGDAFNAMSDLAFEQTLKAYAFYRQLVKRFQERIPMPEPFQDYIRLKDLIADYCKVQCQGSFELMAYRVLTALLQIKGDPDNLLMENLAGKGGKG
ncbi:MAG: hypothetical protein WCR70_04805 [Sphaerochaetaceae bacterium]